MPARQSAQAGRSLPANRLKVKENHCRNSAGCYNRALSTGCPAAPALSAGVVKLVDTGDSKFSSDFVSQGKIVKSKQCQSGEIGRHRRFKISRQQWCAGSSPASGTIPPLHKRNGLFYTPQPR